MTEINKIKHICFDLDGTLVDSYRTIYKTTIKTLEHLGLIKDFDETEFYNRIGHHFADIFRDLDIEVPDIEHFINVYKGFYFDFVEKDDIYPDAMETIKKLHESGFKISLLTTKAQDQADALIDIFQLRPYFNFVLGRRDGVGIKPSPDPLFFICKQLNINPEGTLMVGDSELDIRCGKAAGALTAAAEYGYRTEEAIKKENPDYILHNIRELLMIFKLL